jgi:hypothetical protein
MINAVVSSDPSPKKKTIRVVEGLMQHKHFYKEVSLKGSWCNSKIILESLYYVTNSSFINWCVSVSVSVKLNLKISRDRLIQD